MFTYLNEIILVWPPSGPGSNQVLDLFFSRVHMYNKSALDFFSRVGGRRPNRVAGVGQTRMQSENLFSDLMNEATHKHTVSWEAQQQTASRTQQSERLFLHPPRKENFGRAQVRFSCSSSITASWIISRDYVLKRERGGGKMRISFDICAHTLQPCGCERTEVLLSKWW